MEHISTIIKRKQNLELAHLIMSMEPLYPQLVKIVPHETGKAREQLILVFLEEMDFSVQDQTTMIHVLAKFKATIMQKALVKYLHDLYVIYSKGRTLNQLSLFTSGEYWKCNKHNAVGNNGYCPYCEDQSNKNQNEKDNS